MTSSIAGVATPAIDEVIEWAQERMGRSYLVDGRLEGQDISDVPVPQNYGITRVSQLVKCYEEMSIPSLQLLR